MNWLKEKLKEAENKEAFLNDLREFIAEETDMKHDPVSNVKYVPIEKVQANDYNPNQVATNEMKLLYTSINHDGYTQPVVTVYDEKLDRYVVVDGFHRYSVMRHYKDIYELNKGMLPIVVLDKDINDRMASTIRHNRARGKHSVQGMSHIVFEMLDNGWTDVEIMDELGMEMEELIRLKHITGFSKLFENTEYAKAWEHEKQIRLRKEYEERQKAKEPDSQGVE